VVICTRHRPAVLDRCRWNVRYVLEPMRGVNRARNRGARACDAEIVAFLDDEAVPEPDWLSRLVCEFEDPSVMAVAGRILAFRVETEAERLFALMGGFDCGPRRRVVHRHTPAWFEIASFGGIGNGGGMAFRRPAFDFWEGFHEHMGPGTLLNSGEEHYAFFSLIDRGYKVIYTPQAVVRHPYPRTPRDLRARYRRELAASTAYITLLFAEEPRYRRAIIRYVFEALRGRRRTWRSNSARPRQRLVPGWHVLLARLSGPLLYLLSRMAGATPKLLNSTRIPARPALHARPDISSDGLAG